MIFGKKSSSNAAQNQTADSTAQQNTRILTVLAQDYLKEKKSRRRWGMLIKILVLAYLGFIGFAYFKNADTMISAEHTAIVTLNGAIGPNATTAHQINRSLVDAFEAKSSVGVVIEINSPGGTPVQAAQINEEIHRLKRLYPNKKVYAAITDLCASGGYYVAVAADEIFAHPSSIVGSIGVLMNGFGFVGVMEKLGIERRLITAGENKSILDPFTPVNPQQQAHAQQMLDVVHQQFINAVKQGRGDRLQTNAEIFSGLFWSGEQAQKLGLIDQFGSAEQIARDVIGAEKLVDYTQRPSFYEQFTERLAVSISNAFFNQSISLR